MMKDKYRASLLKSLLQNSAAKGNDSLLQYFSDSMQASISNAHTLSAPALSQGITYCPLDRIHPSWWIPFLEMQTPEELTLYFSVIPKSSQEALLPSFPHVKYIELKHIAASFFSEQLIDWITQKTPLFPISSLPEHPLNYLASISSTELHCTIKYLGFYDLAHELKTVIQSSVLKNINALFTKEEIQFIKELAKHSELLKFAPLHLNNWNGNEEELLQVLYQRGLNRLAKGLDSASLSLFWYVQHNLDPKFSKALKTLKQPTKDSNVYEILLSQIQECVEFCKSRL